MPTLDERIEDQTFGQPVPLVAAPAPVDDAIAPKIERATPALAVNFLASAFMVGDLGYDVFRRCHCVVIRIGYGEYEYQIRVL